MNDNILIIGSKGQIGMALLPALRQIYGTQHVIAADIHTRNENDECYEQLDATDLAKLNTVVKKHQITQIYHLAAILSAKGEENPLLTWNLNMQTLLNVLEAARTGPAMKVFVPSSIAVFGASAPAFMTPQQTYLDPATVYGISKVTAENWSYYYHKKYGLDIRSVRYPGVISHQSMPGGGTTDYAVAIFHHAVIGKDYRCFLEKYTTLPMIYIDDALRATIQLMEAPADKINIRTSYNLAGLSFTPEELFMEIKKHIPDFKCVFEPDYRQKIADSWPKSIDDSSATADWGWKPEFNLSKMTQDMIAHLTHAYKVTSN